MKKIFSLILTAICINGVYSQCNSLFFSEYIEGSSSNKAIEIYNPTSVAIDLTNYTIARFNNGNTTASGTLTFATGTMIPPGDVYITGNASANAAILAASDITDAITYYNGDDAIILYNNITNDTLDAIGKIGIDPGSSWTVGTGATNNTTLVRKNNITQGTTDWAIGATQWDVFSTDMTDSLGAHSIIPCAAPCTNTNSSFAITECTSYIVPSGDETYTTTGTHTVADTIPNHCGSDSIMAITVTILPVLTGNNNTTICATESILINGNTYDATTSTGTEIFTNIGPNNCDSTVTVALNVLASIDISLTNTAPTLTANQTGANYQWLDCDNGNAIITNETGNSFTAAINGNYAVEITMGSCIDTSACTNIATVGIDEIENKAISIYPNPTKNLINIDLRNIQDAINYKLCSIEGRIIDEQQNVSEKSILIELSNESNGIYLLKIETNSSFNVYKIIKR